MKCVIVSFLSTVVACSTAAGSVIVFDNTAGIFDWQPNAVHFDPLLPPDQQGSAATARSLVFEVPGGGGSFTAQAIQIRRAGSSIEVARSPTPVFITNPMGDVFEAIPLRVFSNNALVGPNAIWGAGGSAGWFAPFTNPPFTFVLGQHPTVGFRIPVEGGFQYGFIELELQGFYQPVRWAYETEPNTPITVPTIPSAALLLTAAGALATRRRR